MKLTEPIIRALPSNVKVAMIIILRTQNKNQFIKAVRNLILIIPKFQNNGKENVYAVAANSTPPMSQMSIQLCLESMCVYYFTNII